LRSVLCRKEGWLPLSSWLPAGWRTEPCRYYYRCTYDSYWWATFKSDEKQQAPDSVTDGRKVSLLQTLLAKK
jgi:hypothetical protein